MVEYALIIAVIALALLITQVFFSGQIKNFFSNVANNLTYAARRPSLPSETYPGLLYFS